MPNFVEKSQKTKQLMSFFLLNLECSYAFIIVDVLLNILGENQIDIHTLTCFFADG
jgi:hypothetical protein